MHNFDDFFKDSLTELKNKNLYRDQSAINQKLSTPGIKVFSDNDYLGLANNSYSEILQESKEILAGSTGSRLTTGSQKEHYELETLICDWKDTEATILFNTGYAANTGALACLVNSKDAVFIDELAHSCMWDGVKLSSARKYIFKHNDLIQLQELLEKYRDKHQKALIITESVFSMDGDLAPVAELQKLAQKYQANIFIDEAHSTGIYGSNGAGLIKELLEQGEIQDYSNIIQMGTLSKGVGIEGAYITGSKLLIKFLRNKARTYIYSTALSPISAKIASKNIKIIQITDCLRKTLKNNIGLFRKKLNELILDKNNFKNFHGPIFTFFFENEEKCLTASQKLIEQGYFCSAIRPPTVKEPRIRICISAKHEEKDIIRLSEIIAEIMN
ncbi:MAG: pyridoxal phosphate-dependent aminotransferase family protein [Candidatus Caenarcaniphilales bacterium]|nr:pyridoxal phosphate-dependent aminotransferase family protein [Candidatus Caenarcaniphilales bacterium]